MTRSHSFLCVVQVHNRHHDGQESEQLLKQPWSESETTNRIIQTETQPILKLTLMEYKLIIKQ